MSTFEKNSKAFQKQLADSARWMIRRNDGHDHFWRWSVLTSDNPDREAGRPIFDKITAQNIFEQLEAKKLISLIPNVDPPAYLMVYDMGGWDNVIADGRPLAGLWIKVRRKLWLSLLTFVVGIGVGWFKSEAIDFVRTRTHEKPVQETRRMPVDQAPKTTPPK